MQLNDIVFVFNTYDVLTRNVIDLLLEKDYNVAKIVSNVARVNGTRTFYAYDIEKTIDGKAARYVLSDTSTFSDKKILFLSRHDIFKTLEKAAKENVNLRGIINKLTSEINDYFLKHGLEVIIPDTRFDTYEGD